MRFLRINKFCFLCVCVCAIEGERKKENLVDIKGASIISKIALQMASSGIRTPTFFLAAYLAVVVPYLVHCLGNSLLAVKMKVYCHQE